MIFDPNKKYELSDGSIVGPFKQSINANTDEITFDYGNFKCNGFGKPVISTETRFIVREFKKGKQIPIYDDYGDEIDILEFLDNNINENESGNETQFKVLTDYKSCNTTDLEFTIFGKSVLVEYNDEMYLATTKEDFLQLMSNIYMGLTNEEDDERTTSY